MASTGTLYSFRNKQESEWLHTSDHEELKKIMRGQFISIGNTIYINNEQKKIIYLGCEVLAGEGNHTNECHIGKNYPYSVQCIVTYE